MKAKKKNEEAFPSKDIETLVEMAYKVVAANFDLYPELEGVEDQGVQEEVTIIFNFCLDRQTGRQVPPDNCYGAQHRL